MKWTSLAFGPPNIKYSKTNSTARPTTAIFIKVRHKELGRLKPNNRNGTKLTHAEQQHDQKHDHQVRAQTANKKIGTE